MLEERKETEQKRFFFSIFSLVIISIAVILIVNVEGVDFNDFYGKLVLQTLL